jgi:hypothetical protein
MQLCVCRSHDPPPLCAQALSVVGVIENSTRYSKACCSLLLDSAGIDKLLTFMRGCNRSKPHVETLGHALACLANICRSVCVCVCVCVSVCVCVCVCVLCGLTRPAQSC